jgi:hypothetical protein
VAGPRRGDRGGDGRRPEVGQVLRSGMDVDEGLLLLAVRRAEAGQS